MRFFSFPAEQEPLGALMVEKFDPYYKWLAIPPEDQPPNHYRLLGVSAFESDLDVIAASADRQMAHVKTYASGPHAVVSQQLLNELSRAKILLLRPDKKIAYDNQLKRHHQAEKGMPVATPVAGPEKISASPSLQIDLKDSLPTRQQPVVWPKVAVVVGGLMILPWLLYILLTGSADDVVPSGTSAAQADALSATESPAEPRATVAETPVKEKEGTTKPELSQQKSDVTPAQLKEDSPKVTISNNPQTVPERQFTDSPSETEAPPTNTKPGPEELRQRSVANGDLKAAMKHARTVIGTNQGRWRLLADTLLQTITTSTAIDDLWVARQALSIARSARKQGDYEQALSLGAVALKHARVSNDLAVIREVTLYLVDLRAEGDNS